MRARRFPTAPLALAALLGLVALQLALEPHAAHASEPAPVRIERVKPARPDRPTLRFLKANRDFIRGRYDALKTVPAGDARAESIDPRYLGYARLLAAAQSGLDSAAAVDAARRRLELMASITELGKLETQLDQMDHLLAAQRDRLGVLETDFTGRQQTALVVVLRGQPSGGTVSDVAIALEDGTRLTVTLDDAQREALSHGGVVELFHGFVEPREQAIEVSVHGGGWPENDTGWITLDPARDHLTFLALDLEHVRPERGVAAVPASTWLHEPAVPDSPAPPSATPTPNTGG
jgi:hypothetical protein